MRVFGFGIILQSPGPGREPSLPALSAEHRPQKKARTTVKCRSCFLVRLVNRIGRIRAGSEQVGIDQRDAGSQSPHGQLNLIAGVVGLGLMHGSLLVLSFVDPLKISIEDYD